MTPSPQHRYFFMHVMKTGGSSFDATKRANFSREECYPDCIVSADSDFFRKTEAYLYVPGILSTVEARFNELRFVSGHVPYAVRDLLAGDYIALTLMREPVDRVVSHLKHCRRYHNEHRGLSLEEIYEDHWFKATFLQNYQTKLFSMTKAETLAEVRLGDSEPRLPPRAELGDGSDITDEIRLLSTRAPGRFAMECFAASTGVIEANRVRLQQAKDNLSNVEVVGFTNDYEQFLQLLHSRYGWKITAAPHRHAGEHESISTDLIKKIAEDNALDMELYDYAKTLRG